MIQFDEFQRGVLLEGLRDFQSMWELAGDMRDAIGPHVDHDAVRLAVGNSIRPLVVEMLVEIGDLVSAGAGPKVRFVPWSLRGIAAMDELERQWVELGRDPEIGEIGWIRLMPRGKKIARRLEGNS